MCDNWDKNKLQNPFTKRSISKDKVIYKQFESFCINSKKNCSILKDSINPITNRKLSDNSKLKSFLKLLCPEKEEIVAKKLLSDVKETEDYYNYTESPLQCTLYDTITLKEHQKHVCSYISKHPSTKGLVLFHSVGSGKTATSITLIRCLLAEKPDTNVFVITPTSLIENFKKELINLKVEFGKNVKIYSHQKFVNKIDKEGAAFCKDSVIIIDEAHNFKTINGTNVKLLMKGTYIASKVFLLTATPIQNNPSEFANLYAMITKKEKDIRELYKTFESASPKIFYNMFKNKISYFKNSDTSEYPSVTYKNIYFTMTPEYYKSYMIIEENQDDRQIFKSTSNLSIFYNGIRRAVNYIDENITTPKIEWAIKHIKKSIKHNKKVVIYSNWLRSGLGIIQERLNAENIDWVQVNGSMSPRQRNIAVSKYNTDKIFILFISSAGAEGLDLKGTQSVILLEPHWNNEKIKQIVGRAVRYRSHANLPKKDQHVNIFHLILQKPTKCKDKLKSADDYLINISHEKEKKTDEFYEILLESSI